MSHTMSTIHQGTISNTDLINWIQMYGHMASSNRVKVALDLFHKRAEKITLNDQSSKWWAISAMMCGSKVTHKLFSPEEWMTLEDGVLLFEDGVHCDVDKFWADRCDHSWDSGYKLWSDPNDLQA